MKRTRLSGLVFHENLGTRRLVPCGTIGWVDVTMFRMNTIYMIEANWVIVVDIYGLFLKLMCIQTPYNEYELAIALYVVIYSNVIVLRLG